MKPLSKEASAALGALKATEPSAADEARVRQGLERTLGIAVPTATVAIAASAQAATGLAALGVGAKTLILVGSLVAAGVTVSLSSRGGEGRGEEAKPQQLAKAPAPALVAQAPEVEEPTQLEVAPAPAPLAAPPEVKAPPPPKRVVAPPPVAELPAPPEAPVEEPEVVAAPPPPPPSAATAELEVETNFPLCDAETELRSAGSARKLLEASRAEEAVWLLGAYQRRCPSGRWSNEAWAVRMAGLCKLGRNAEVVGLLQWFSAEYPARRAAVMADLQSWCPAEVLHRE